MNNAASAVDSEGANPPLPFKSCACVSKYVFHLHTVGFSRHHSANSFYQGASMTTQPLQIGVIGAGAIASSVGHDSHNIIAVGIDDESICKAVNLIIKAKGGVSAVSEGKEEILSLPVGGIMSDADGYEVAEAYTRIDRMAKEMGSKLNSPFMTLSFMALLVIPDLKLSDKGLFNGQKFEFTEVFFVD